MADMGKVPVGQRVGGGLGSAWGSSHPHYFLFHPIDLSGTMKKVRPPMFLSLYGKSRGIRRRGHGPLLGAHTGAEEALGWA